MRWVRTGDGTRWLPPCLWERRGENEKREGPREVGRGGCAETATGCEREGERERWPVRPVYVGERGEWDRV